MAVTITNITTPNSSVTEFPYGIFKARMVDVTFDSTYPTAGEIITAANLGWSQLVGGVVINDPAPSGLATTIRTRVVPNTALTQVKLQLFQSGYDPTTTFTRSVLNVAATADLNSGVVVAPFTGTVTRCKYVAVSTLTGADTNSRTLSLKNLTQTLVPATKAFTAGVNATADLATDITLGNAANVAVTSGDVLRWESLHIGGSGLADPGGLVVVDITPNFAGVSLKELANNTDASTLTGRYLLIGN